MIPRYTELVKVERRGNGHSMSVFVVPANTARIRIGLPERAQTTVKSMPHIFRENCS